MKINVAQMELSEDPIRFNRIKEGRYRTSNMDRYAPSLSKPMSDKDYEDTVRELFRLRKIFFDDQENYWCFITVEGSDVCGPSSIEKFMGQFPWLKYEKYHESPNFANGNYFEGNYLQFHILKVDLK